MYFPSFQALFINVPVDFRVKLGLRRALKRQKKTLKKIPPFYGKLLLAFQNQDLSRVNSLPSFPTELKAASETISMRSMSVELETSEAETEQYLKRDLSNFTAGGTAQESLNKSDLNVLSFEFVEINILSDQKQKEEGRIFLDAEIIHSISSIFATKDKDKEKDSQKDKTGVNIKPLEKLFSKESLESFRSAKPISPLEGPITVNPIEVSK